MMPPVRCWTCGKPVAEHYDEFRERVAKGEEPEKVLDDFGFTRYCCRRMLIAEPNLISEIIRFRRF